MKKNKIKKKISCKNYSFRFTYEDFKNDLHINQLCDAVCGDLGDSTRGDKLKWLNNKLGLTGFCNLLIKRFPKCKDSKEIVDILKETAGIRKKRKKELTNKERNSFKKINRLLLHDIYPDLCPPLSKYGRPNKNIFNALRLKRMHDYIHSRFGYSDDKIANEIAVVEMPMKFILIEDGIKRSILENKEREWHDNGPGKINAFLSNINLKKNGRSF